MKALTGNSAERQALLDEYQIALRMWSETKVLYPLESAEFAEATGHLDQLEQDLVLAQVARLAKARIAACLMRR